MGGWICIGAVLVLVALWLLPRHRRYSRIFSDEHFLEVAQGAAGLKHRALAHIGEELVPTGDPRILRTSAGLVVFYTIDGPDPDGLTHHVSVSVPGEHTTGAVGRRFTLLAAVMIGLPLDHLDLGYSNRGVHHAAVLLPASDHEAVSTQPLRIIGKSGVPALRAEVEAAVARLHWSNVGDPLPQDDPALPKSQ